MRKMLKATIVEVIPAFCSGKVRRVIPQEGHNLRGTGGRNLLVGETHPHRSLRIYTTRKGEIILVSHLAWQPNLHKLRANGREIQQPVEGKVWRRNEVTPEHITTQQPVDRIIDVVQGVATERENEIVRLDAHRHIEGRLRDTRILRRDIGGTGHGLFQDIATGI